MKNKSTYLKQRLRNRNFHEKRNRSCVFREILRHLCCPSMLSLLKNWMFSHLKPIMTVDVFYDIPIEGCERFALLILEYCNIFKKRCWWPKTRGSALYVIKNLILEDESLKKKPFWYGCQMLFEFRKKRMVFCVFLGLQKNPDYYQD